MSALRIAAKVLPAEKGFVIMHGLGDCANGFPHSIADYLRNDPAFARTSFILPNAPVIPLSIDNGSMVPGWFDMYEFTVRPKKADVEGFVKSLGVVEGHVKEHIDAGIAPENIIVCGFSQGAALALASAVTLPVKIGGFVGFSGFVTIPQYLKQNLNSFNLDTPILHGHGDSDPIIPLESGKIARDFYQEECGFRNFQFRVYKDMEHTVNPDELADFISFTKKVLKLGSA